MIIKELRNHLSLNAYSCT